MGMGSLFLLLWPARKVYGWLGSLVGRGVADGLASRALSWAFIHELPKRIGWARTRAIAAAALLADGPFFVALLAG